MTQITNYNIQEVENFDNGNTVSIILIVSHVTSRVMSLQMLFIICHQISLQANLTRVYKTTHQAHEFNQATVIPCVSATLYHTVG